MSTKRLLSYSIEIHDYDRSFDRSRLVDKIYRSVNQICREVETKVGATDSNVFREVIVDISVRGQIVEVQRHQIRVQEYSTEKCYTLMDIAYDLILREKIRNDLESFVGSEGYQLDSNNGSY